MVIKMIKSLKYADFLKINNSIHMVKNIEILNNHLIEKLKIKICKMLFLKKDDSYYYFKECETNEQFKYTIPFIGSDFKYIIDEELKLMKLRRKIDMRIEPHLIRIEDYRKADTPFVKEVIDSGIKVA